MAFSCLGFGGCQVDEKSETLYSYRESESCGDHDSNKTGSDRKKGRECKAVLVSSFTLRVFPEIQRVTFFEEDYGHAPNERKWTAPQELTKCKIIDGDTFSCDFLVRISGKFTNTEAIDGRRLSSGIYPKYWAQLNDGWIYENFLSMFDTPSIDFLYLIGILGGGIFLLFRLLGRIFQ
jgi:hypothetical protein